MGPHRALCVPHKVSAEDIARIQLFADLAAEARVDIAANACGWIYRANQRIFGYEECSRDVYFLVSGRVRVAMQVTNDRPVIFRNMAPGQMFGELSAIDGKPRSAFVYSLEETKLVRIGEKQFKSLMDHCGIVRERVMRHMCTLVRELSMRVYEHGALPVSSRIPATLLRLVHQSPTPDENSSIEVKVTQEELARHVGATRPGVNRVLGKLRAAGIVETAEGIVRILDLNGLEHLVTRGRSAPRYSPRGTSAALDPA